MLHATKDLIGRQLEASDGQVGSCDEFLFDDRTWKIRYMVAETGGWLTRRKVLISPDDIDGPDAGERVISVDLDASEIKEAPLLSSDAPVSRQYQLTWTRYRGLTPSWSDFGPLSAPLVANRMAMELQEAEHDHHLRSSREVTGYQATSDLVREHRKRLGRIADFVTNDQTWDVAFAIVEVSKGWFRSEQILIPRDKLRRVGWAEDALYVRLSPETMRDFPPYDPSKQIDLQIKDSAYDACGMPRSAEWN